MVAIAPGREHIPGHPKAFIAVRFISLIIGLVVLACDAYSLSRLAFSGNSLMMFTSIANLITCLYVIVAELGVPAAYNYWPVLGLDVFMAVFWLVSFALLASQVAPLFKGVTYCDWYYGCYSYELEGESLAWSAVLAAVAGLGGLEFALYIVALVIGSIYLSRHRKAGGHCMPLGAGAATSAPTAAAAPGGEKTEAGATYTSTVPLQEQQPPYQPQQQQPGYPAGQAMTPPPQQMHQPQPYYPQQTPSPLTAQSSVAGYPPQQQQQPQAQYHEVSGTQAGYNPQQQQQQHQQQQQQ
ncbi:uncharacterized protein E0L32_003316 [Thyridium curvatum]|uniref:MARVEL domain-containing protein n=1 Tax=Thyridium curvatum TaxID=1093900 RepID=A0A507BKG4_9PEZI|nr:uncharacterized protein E0L32_003316 [Thyridium curvatum]TPX17198.1 hypothetical protein E0L32_003316 [Thyridium curvatum]